jgi:ferritin-like metal-binding protein YciE
MRLEAAGTQQPGAKSFAHTKEEAMLNTMQDLLVHELEGMYDAENQLVEALPKMAKTAASKQLKSAFESHLEETKNHVKRLDQVFKSLGKPAKGKTCQAMKGLIKAGGEMISEWGSDEVRDAGLIAAAQCVEHHEIACYGCARTWAQQLGHADVVRLLDETLNEEKACNQKLNTIAESAVNQKAAAHAHA